MKIKCRTLSKVIIFYCILYSMTRSVFAQFTGSLGNLLFLIFSSAICVLYFLYNDSMIVKIKKNPFFIGLFYFFLVYLLNLCTTSNSSLYSLNEYILYLALFFGIVFVLKYVSFSWILKIYCFIGTFVGAEAIWEFMTGNILYRYAYQGAQIIRRAFGLVGSPLTLGMMLACTSLMCVYLYMHGSRIFGLCFIANFGGLLCTQSRGPLVSFLIGLAIVYILNDCLNKEGIIYKLQRILWVLLALVVCYYIFAFLSEHNDFINTIYNRLQTITEWGNENATNNERYNRWLNALEIFRNNWLIGYGVSSTGPHSSTGIITESGVLKILAETGVLGFIFYFGTLYYGVISRGLRCLKKNVEFSPLAISIIVSISVENVILQIMESATINLIFMMMLAFLFVYDEKSK